MDDTLPSTDDTNSVQDQQPTSTTLPPTPVMHFPQVTRSGRRVHWLKRLVEYRSLT